MTDSEKYLEGKVKKNSNKESEIDLEIEILIKVIYRKASDVPFA